MPATIASASGCSELFSAAPTSRRKSLSAIPSGSTLVSSGFPFVTVPVLSRMTVSTLCVVSKCSPPLNSTPSSAARPEPAMMEVGVASPSAHGQAITNIAMAISSACAKLPGEAQKYQIIKQSTAIPTTMGTKIPDMTSATR
ncbi:hypothetical protein D3C77_645450 [compost metagenome]